MLFIFYKKNSKLKGISLIITIITIVISIIIMSAIFMSFSENGIITNVQKASFLNDLGNFKTELNLYNMKQKSKIDTKYNKILLYADQDTYIYDNIEDANKNIFDILKSLKRSKYKEDFKIVYGQIVYQGENTKFKKYAEDYGIKLLENVLEDNIPPIVNFSKKGECNISIANTIVTVIDSGGSKLNEGSLEYVWDTQRINEPDNGWLSFQNGQEIIKNNLNGTYYLWIRAKDNAGNKVLEVSEEFSSLNIVKANAPILTQGMVPVKWSEEGELIETVVEDVTWYNYNDKQWANAKTVDGSLWVWIPRYEYKINNSNSSNAETIEINFLKDISNTITENYIKHPAFNFGTTELKGIWVAKFEASGTKDSINIKPGQKPLMRIKIQEMFVAAKNIKNNNKYGWDVNDTSIDTHLIKNIEWGAVAYISNSIYGKNANITLNDFAGYSTGGGDENAYKNNVGQSTTGNVYGIYDMSGCSWEYVAAYINNGTPNLINNGNDLYLAEEKYKDIYVTGASDSQSLNYSANSNKKGDAIYETSSSYNGFKSWYNGPSYMIYSTTPFFRRGGDIDSGNNAGIFSFNNFFGANFSNFGFRPVIVKE